MERSGEILLSDFEGRADAARFGQNGLRRSGSVFVGETGPFTRQLADGRPYLPSACCELEESAGPHALSQPSLGLVDSTSKEMGMSESLIVFGVGLLVGAIGGIIVDRFVRWWRELNDEGYYYYE